MNRIINLKLTPPEKLLPCPFCGSANLELGNTWTACYWIMCDDCTAEVHGEPFGEDDGKGHYRVRAHRKAKASAIEKWNTREARR